MEPQASVFALKNLVNEAPDIGTVTIFHLKREEIPAF